MKNRMLLALAVFFLLAVVPISSAPAPDDPILELSKARLKAAQETYREVVALYKRFGRLEGEGRYAFSKRILEGEKEAAKNKEEVVAAHQAHLERMLEFETLAKRDADPKHQLAGPDAVAAAAFYRAEAELFLARAKVNKR